MTVLVTWTSEYSVNNMLCEQPHVGEQNRTIVASRVALCSHT